MFSGGYNIKAKPDISIIIVNYNVKSYLEQALKSILKALTHIPSEIIVVDNASTDGSVRLVREQFPEVMLIANKLNAGFAKANNQALKKARGRFVCLINPDTLVREDTFSTCIDYMVRHPDTGMLGCKILNPDGSLQLACRRSFPTPWVAFTKMAGLSRLFPKSRWFGRYNLTYMDPDKTTEVEAISGSFMVVRKKTIRDAGPLDEDFFLYGEDLDWCYRIHQAGWKIVYLPATQIIHYKGRSAKEAPFDNLRIFYGAMQLFVMKHFHRGWVFLPRWLLMTGIWLRGGLSFLSQLIQRLLIPMIDFAFLQAGLFAAILVWLKTPDYWPRYLIVNGIYSMIWLGCFWGMGLYRRRVFSASNAIAAVFFGFLFNTSVTFFLPDYQFSRAVMLIAAFLDAVFLGSWRLVLRLAIRKSRLPAFNRLGHSLVNRRTAIAGTGHDSLQILKHLRRHPDTGYEVIGLVSLSGTADDSVPDSDLPLLGNLDEIERVARAHRIHDVIFPAEAVSYERMLGFMARGKELNLDFKMVPGHMDVLIGRSHIDTLNDLSLMDLDYSIFQGWNILLKRWMDILFVLCMLPAALPVTVFVWLHPRFRFRRRMIADGLGRSMSITEILKTKKRASGWIQAVPLLWPILRGRLTVIGTEILDYHPGTQARGFKPGLTGLVQVHRAKKLTEEEKKRYTHHYMKNYSVFLDIEILLKSVFRD